MKYEIRWYTTTVIFIAGVNNEQPWQLVKTRTTRWWWRARLAHFMDAIMPKAWSPIGVVLTKVCVRVLP